MLFESIECWCCIPPDSFLVIFFLVLLLIVESGIFEMSNYYMDFPISLFNSIEFWLTCFVALLFGACTFATAVSSWRTDLFCHYITSFSVSAYIVTFEVSLL
jgi:hypothetical protein